MNRRQFIKTGLKLGVAAGIAASSTLMHPGITKCGEAKNMKILVLTGSPRKDGNSNELATQFALGARESGHDVFTFHAAQKNVHPCIACNSCGMDGPCIFKDDFQIVREHIVPADMVVFVTPQYYYTVSTQLKAVIDRFYAINGQIHVPKKSAFFLTYANSDPDSAVPVIKYYEKLLEYLGWSDAGSIIAPGVWTAGSIKTTSFPMQAYNFGKKL